MNLNAKKITSKIIYIIFFVLLFYPRIDLLFSNESSLSQQNPSEKSSIQNRLETHSFPKIFLQHQDPLLGKAEVRKMAKWDFLILDAEAVEKPTKFLGESGLIRSLNPNAVIVTYFSAGDIIPGNSAPINGGFIAKLKNGWYMKDIYGARLLLFELIDDVWSEMLNLTTPVNNFMPKYLNKAILSKELVDGIFYDWIIDDISWLNHRENAPCGLPDINNDGLPDTDEFLNSRWITGTKKMLKKTGKHFPEDYLILGNSGGVTSDTYGDLLDGLMIEYFLGADWAYMLRKHYLHLKSCRSPSLSMIMANGDKKDYQTVRYALCSTLMFDGYFTYTNIGAYEAVWWYDEYAVNVKTGKAKAKLKYKGYLGDPLGDAFNVNDSEQMLKDILLTETYFEAGEFVWRRDFTNGIVLINPSDNDVSVNLGEKFRKIKGIYDKSFNNGKKVRLLDMKKRSGIILLRIK